MIELVLRTTESSGMVREQILVRLEEVQALPDADPILMAQKQKQERYADVIAGQLALASQDMRDTREIVKKVLDAQISQESKAKELAVLIEELQKRYGVVSGNLLKSAEYINKLENELQRLQQETELLKLQLRKKGN